MPAAVKAEAVVLRSIRYGEADRIVHAYTPHRGRIGAIVKGVRRAKSRFGGRLEPFTHVSLILHEGRSDLMTVTGADTVTAFADLRTDGAAIDCAARACDAVLRMFDTDEGNPPVFHLLVNELTLLDAGVRDDRPQATHANQLAFRLKLLLLAGLAPQLASCATCGQTEELVAFSGAAGGVVCHACEAGAFRFDEEAHAFLTGALALPLAQAPSAEPRALRQAERALAETVEHHGHVRLRAAAAR